MWGRARRAIARLEPDSGRYHKANAELKHARWSRGVWFSWAIPLRTCGNWTSTFPASRISTAALADRRRSKCWCEMYPDVIDLHPAAMVLLAGTNDVAHNTSLRRTIGCCPHHHCGAASVRHRLSGGADHRGRAQESDGRCALRLNRLQRQRESPVGRRLNGGNLDVERRRPIEGSFAVIAESELASPQKGPIGAH